MYIAGCTLFNPSGLNEDIKRIHPQNVTKIDNHHFEWYELVSVRKPIAIYSNTQIKVNEIIILNYKYKTYLYKLYKCCYEQAFILF